MVPVVIDDIKTNPSAPAAPVIAGGGRLSLDPSLAQRRGINGAWWPQDMLAAAGITSGESPVAADQTVSAV